jgi:hypothetical protein
MTRRIVPVACFLLAWAASAFAAGKPVVRVAFQPSGSVVVGQQVKLTVTILVPNFFLSAPDWPVLDVDGAVVTMPEDVMPHLTETIDGDSYAGVQKLYVITPQQDGEIRLSAVAIHFKYSAVPGQPPVDGVVTLPVAHFTAAWPEGARIDAGVLPVARLTVQQAVDRRGTSFKAGQTLTRTITTIAANTQPMMILPPEVTAPDGVRIYEKDPVLSTDLGVHGELNAGRRVDRVTYLFEKPGHYTLPAVEYPWFDAAAKKRMTATAPAIVVDVAPDASVVPVIPPEAPPPTPPPPAASPWIVWKKRLPLIGEGLAALIVAIWLARRLWPRYRAWSTARRIERKESEAAYFAHFETACSRGDPSRAYAALARWAWRTDHLSIASFCAVLGSDAFSDEVSTLERRLFAHATSASQWSGTTLRRTAADARRRWLSTRAHRTRHRSSLPALNP